MRKWNIKECAENKNKDSIKSKYVLKYNKSDESYKIQSYEDI